jgi:hypothetical protein
LRARSAIQLSVDGQVWTVTVTRCQSICLSPCWSDIQTRAVEAEVGAAGL